MDSKHDCKELLGPLSDYISGEISESMCARIQEHLAECRDCREMLESIKRTISLYRLTTPTELPLDVRRRLYQALDLDEFFTPAVNKDYSI